jgi:hypothetical protein
MGECKNDVMPYTAGVAISPLQWGRSNDARPGSTGLDGGGMR